MTTTTHRRETYQRNREIRRAIAAEAVAEAVGPITPGLEVFGVTKGKWSLIDLIEHCLKHTGPADVVLSTWTAAGADLRFAYRLMTTGAITSLRFLVDFSFPARQPAYCAALRETFGDECIRISKNHCKFVLIRAAEWNLVIRTSMNLNENRRLESYEISDDPAMADFIADLVREVFDTQPAAGQFAKRPVDHVRQFETLAENNGVAADTIAALPDAALTSTDTKKFYSTEPFGNDLARAGLSYVKGGAKK